MSFSTIATPFIKLGIPVFPLTPKTKIPISNIDWLTAATTDAAQIEIWDAENPNYNVALVAGDFCFLEFDQFGIKSAAEEMGEQVPTTRIQQSGSGGAHLIFKATERSRKLGNRSVSLNGSEWFSFRSQNKYLVGAGSLHPNGKYYKTKKDIEPTPIPNWVCDFVERYGETTKPKPKNSVSVADDFDPDDLFEFFDIAGHWEDEWFICDECPIAEYRHHQSTKTGFFYDGNTFGFKCFATGCNGSTMSASQVVAFLNQKNGRPYTKLIWEHDDDDFSGLDEMNLVTDDMYLSLLPKDVPTAVSVATTPNPELTIQKQEPEPEPELESKQPAQVVVEPKPEPIATQELKKELNGMRYAAYVEHEDFNTGLILKPMDKYETVKLCWMWPQRIPRGKITLFTGKPDCGKSLVSLDVIARITTGQDWPDGSKNELPPSRVMMAFTEDDVNDTTIPRLIAAGADLSKIENVVGTMMEIKTKGKPKRKARRTNLDLKRDYNILLEALKDNPDIALLVLDPISSFFGGGADQNKDSDIRPLMDQIAKMCSKSGLTVLGIIHSNKKEGLDSVQRVSGASALAASTRSIWGFSKDKENKGTYRMAHVKGNLAEDKSGLFYKVLGTPVQITNGEEVSAPKVEWGSGFEEDADDLSASDRQNLDKKDSKMIEAMAIIRIQKFPLKLKEFYEKVEKDTGIGVNTLKRAKYELKREGFVIDTEKNGSCWYWTHIEHKEQIKEREAVMEKKMLEIDPY